MYRLSIRGPKPYGDQSTIQPMSGCKAIVRNIKLSMIKLYMYIIEYFYRWSLLEEIGDSRGSKKATKVNWSEHGRIHDHASTYSHDDIWNYRDGQDFPCLGEC